MGSLLGAGLGGVGGWLGSGPLVGEPVGGMRKSKKNTEEGDGSPAPGSGRLKTGSDKAPKKKNVVNVASHQFLAPSARREFTPEEEEAVEAGKSRWLPTLFQSYSTPVPAMMADPGKQALLAGLLGAGLGGSIGLGLGHRLGNENLGGAIGAGIGGLGAGGLAYFARQAKNQDLEEIMRRLPPGARKRDYLADPAVQADLLRSSFSSAASRLPIVIPG
jgi:hypothetical protein